MWLGEVLLLIIVLPPFYRHGCKLRTLSVHFLYFLNIIKNRHNAFDFEQILNKVYIKNIYILEHVSVPEHTCSNFAF